MVPVCCGSAYRNKGVQTLLDAIVDYMPAPTDVPSIKGTNPDTGKKLTDILQMMSHSQLLHSRLHDRPIRR